MAIPLVYQIADRLTPRMRAQFLVSVRKLRDSITLASLETAVGRRGWPSSINSAFIDFEAELNRTVGATNNAVWERAARATEDQLLTRAGVRASFDIVNPLAVQAAEQRSALLIRQITAETRAAVQQIISRSISDGIPPRVAAGQIRQVVGLTSRMATSVQTLRNELRAMGTPVRAVNAATQRYADRMIRKRGLTIARTETIRASVEGQQDAWSSAQFRNLIPDTAMQVWIVANDERLCPVCLGLNDQQAPIGGAFTSSGSAITGPPAHPNCRCALGLVYPRQRRH